MSIRQLLTLFTLAALWGGSFLFIRLAVPEFGPVPLSAARAAVATALLLPLLLLKGQWQALAGNWAHMLVLALISTAIPVVCLSISTQYTSAGFASITNSLTPLFSALVAWLWLKEYLTPAAIIGILLGFGGVVVMVFDREILAGGFVLLPILAALCATFLYGLTGNYSRRFATGVPALAIATGCQMFSALVLFPPALALWPQTPIPAQAWGHVLVLGIFCTGLAYLLFFSLLEQVGVARTVIVTYLVPVFALVWAYLILDETITLRMLAGAACILAGIGLTTYRKKGTPA